MRLIRNTGAAICGALLVTRFVACSPSSGDGNNGNPLSGTGASGNDASLTGNAGNGNQLGNGGGGSLLGGDTGIGITHVPEGDGSCAAVTQAPEEITVFRDATVTDTITTYSPVAIYIMQDRSTSMNTGLGGGSAQSWGYATNALQAFVADPASAGLDVGIGFFPPTANGQGACDGSDCGQPNVPIASLPNNGPPIMNAMTAATPTLIPILLTPTECAMRGMISYCNTYQAQSHEQCVAILITDGTPTSCDTNDTDLEGIAAQGKAAGILTFTLGLTGADLNFLNAVAKAGGTNAAIDVSGGTTAFLAALNAIRGKVTKQTKTHTTKQEVIATQLDCQWRIPPPQGGTFDPDKVNVELKPANGAAQQFVNVPAASACTTTDPGWYYDIDPAAGTPTQVLACPKTCDLIKASTGASVNIAFGCKTIKVSVH